MERNKLIVGVLAGAIAAGVLGTPGAVYARSGCEMASSEAVSGSARVTIAQAIAIAERHVGGEAIGAGSENADGTSVFYVDVLKYGRKRKVIVDLQSGLIVKSNVAGNCNA